MPVRFVLCLLTCDYASWQLVHIATSSWKWLATVNANESSKMKSWQDVDDKTAATLMEYEEEGRAEKRQVAQRKTPHSLPLPRNKRKKWKSHVEKSKQPELNNGRTWKDMLKHACLTLNMVDTKLSLCLSWSNEYFWHINPFKPTVFWLAAPHKHNSRWVLTARAVCMRWPCKDAASDWCSRTVWIWIWEQLNYLFSQNGDGNDSHYHNVTRTVSIMWGGEPY